MNIRKSKVINLIIAFFILMQFIIPTYANISVAATEQDVYDVILFWGQSNMVGYCGLYSGDNATENNTNDEKQADSRYNRSDKTNITDYSNKTGIDEQFLLNAEQMNYVKISQTANTVYEYQYTTNKLIELTESTKNLGEKLLYNEDTKKLETASSKYSIQKSYGTNIIPQFCKTYYQKTGHKVVAVFAANGGEKIANFLPSTDSDYGDANKQMIYEAMCAKYKAAINFMDSKGYKIGNRLWVSFQGESDVLSTSTDKYKKTFLKVHNNLKKDLKITKGTIIQTSRTIGTEYNGVKNINKAQVELAEENVDIILGSSYAYDHYIPDETTYNSSEYSNSVFTDSNGKKLKYKDALNIASLSVCYPGNTIHFTSSVLCQIGKETATKLADAINDLTSPILKVTYSTTSATNKDVTVTITSNEQIKAVSGWTLSSNKKILTKTYTANGGEEVTVYDIAGNSAKTNISVANIDKVAPTIKTSYSTTLATNKDVTVTITSNEQMKTLSGWTLSSDKMILTKVYTENGGEEVTVYDVAGNSAKTNISVANIDKVAPTIKTSYSTTSATNKDVTVTITSNEQMKTLSGWTLSSDKRTLTKTYTANGGEEVTVYDIAGNSAKASISVANIDKVAPVIKTSYSTTLATNKDITVTITSNEQIKAVSGWTLSSDKRTLTKTYTANGGEEVTVYDVAGNSAKANISVANIDKVAPTIKTSYSTTSATNKDVTVTITSNEQMKTLSGWTLSSDKRTLTKTYTANGGEEVIVYDIAGNSAKASISVANIDKAAPVIKTSYSTTSATNEDVTVTITSNEQMKNLSGWILSNDKRILTKVYTTNGGEEVTVYDIAGNSIKVNISITNIDKEIPVVDINYSTTEPTNEDVIVTITSNEPIQGVESWTLLEDGKTITKVYTANGGEEVTVYDIAGNSVKVNISVENIDKEIPVVDINYSTTEPTNEDVIVTITSNELIQDVEGWTLLEDGKTITKVYTANGGEEVTVYDIAGNSIKVNINVTNIDKEIPAVDVNYSTTEPTNEDVIVTITSNEPIQEIESWTLLEDGKTMTKVYNINGKEEITVCDIAGNSVKLNIDVTNIDKGTPVVNINYSTTEITNEDVIVTITANEPIQEIEGWTLSSDKKVLTKAYTANGTEEVIVYDIVGNAIKININVTNINKIVENEYPHTLPQAGQKTIILIIIIFGLTIFAGICYKKNKNLKFKI